MKKALILACALGALLSCNREDVAGLQNPTDPPAVNESTEGSIPVHLSIKGGQMQTRATEANAKESELANVKLTIQAWGSSSLTPAYTKTYDLGDNTDIIVNIDACQYAYFTVESGDYKDGEFQKTLEGQKEHLYAMGQIKVDWDAMQNQDTPFEITMSRLINKITIEKISVDWANENFDSREFKIKRIFLSDVPRFSRTNYASMSIKGYNSSFTGEKDDIQFYNFGGLEGYEVKCVNDYKMYKAPVYRLDEQLVDEVDKVVSKDSPYTTPHTFYAYVSNSAKVLPYISTAATASNYVNLYVPMTSIVIEAEMEGDTMYYKFPVLTAQSTAPANTHIRFSELVITESGSESQNGAKTYENFSYTFSDWNEDNRTEPTPNL